MISYLATRKKHEVQTWSLWSGITKTRMPLKFKVGPVPRLVVFGQAECVRFFETEVEMSEETLESFFAVRKHESHDFCHQLRKADYEGVPWLDVRTAVESPAGREMSISGPMLNLTLAPGEVHRFPDPDDGIIEVLLGDTSSLQCQLLSRQYAGVTFEGLGPLDQVDLETYLRLWFKAGATGGQIKGGKFENGYN